MKKRLIKILSMIIIIISIIGICDVVLASSPGNYLINTYDGTIHTDGKKAEKKINEIVDAVLSAVRIVGVGVAIIMCTILGIQYMSASPSEKANIKTKLVILVVGAFVFFGAVQILDFIKGYADAITK